MTEYVRGVAPTAEECAKLRRERDAALAELAKLRADFETMGEGAQATIAVEQAEAANLRRQIGPQNAEIDRLREALETAKAQAEATPLHPFCAMVISTCATALSEEGRTDD